MAAADAVTSEELTPEVMAYMLGDQCTPDGATGGYAEESGFTTTDGAMGSRIQEPRSEESGFTAEGATGGSHMPQSRSVESGFTTDGATGGSHIPQSRSVESGFAPPLDGASADLEPQSRLVAAEDPNNNEDAHALSVLRSALVAADAGAIKDLVTKGLCGADTVTDTRKYYNPMHELILTLVSYDILEAIQLRQRFLECITVLLDAGIDINDTDITSNTPLHLLCQHTGHSTVIRELVAAGASVNKTNCRQQTALHLAAEAGGCKEVEALLDGGADPDLMDAAGHTALHKAVKYRRSSELIKSLAGCGANISIQQNTFRNRGPTALHVAVRSLRPENVDLLLDLGAHTDSEDASGQTPLHLAAANDITGLILRSLVDAGANINRKDAMLGETPLHKALKRGLPDNVATLCARGADVNIRDLLGETPLHKAAQDCRDLSIWMRLANTRADLNVKSGEGRTASDKASRTGNAIAVTVLKQMAA